MWKSKVMMYAPLWAHLNPVCTTTPTNATKSYIYHDFLGNDEGTTDSIYLMKKDNSASQKTTIENYAVYNFRTQYPKLCENDQYPLDPNPLRTYTNPICIQTKNIIFTSHKACDNQSISDYSNENYWVLPSDLENIHQDNTIDIPTTL